MWRIPSHLSGLRHFSEQPRGSSRAFPRDAVPNIVAGASCIHSSVERTTGESFCITLTPEALSVRCCTLLSFLTGDMMRVEKERANMDLSALQLCGLRLLRRRPSIRVGGFSYRAVRACYRMAVLGHNISRLKSMVKTHDY